jgi:hypothetical protein
MPSTKTKSSTRTRKPAASKTAKQNAKAKAAAAKKAADAKAKAQAEREAKAAAREEAKVAERQKLIDNGELIVNGDAEFHRTDSETGEVEKRAEAVLKALKSSKIPVVGKDLQEEFGGGWPQYLSFFSLLKAQGTVIEYRRRTGERGGAGVAYLHVDNA